MQKAGPGVASIGEHVAHIVKEDEADGVAKPGERRRRQAQLRGVDQRARSTDGKAGFRIARAGAVEGEAAQLGGTAGIETLGQWNELARSGAEGAHLAVTRVAGQHKAIFVEAVVA